MFSSNTKSHVAINPWRRSDESFVNSSGSYDGEESRGLLAEEATSFTNYQSGPAPRRKLSESIARGVLAKTFWLRIAAMLFAMGILLSVILLSKGSVVKVKSANGPVMLESKKTLEKCVDLGPLGSQILPWIQAITGRKLKPRSCWVSEAASTPSCPNNTLNSSVSPPNLDSVNLNETSLKERSEDDIVCEHILEWMRGFEDSYENKIPNAVEQLIRILDGTPEAVDSELVELQVFGLPQVLQFEKFKLHHGWFESGKTSIDGFGAVVGYGFQVYCGSDLILHAGGGVGAGFAQIEGFETGYGGSVSVTDSAIGVKLHSTALQTFYEHFEDTVRDIQNCPSLTLLGGSGWGGGLDIDGRGYQQGHKTESFILGPAPFKVSLLEKLKEKKLFQQWLPEVGGFVIPMKFSDVVSTRKR